MRMAGVLLLLVPFATQGVAQQPVEPSPPAASEQKPEASVPPVPRDCQAGSTQVVTQVSLPNVATAMRERSRINILAVGASPIMRADAGPGRYYSLVEHLLEQTFKGLEVQITHRGLSGELVRDASARIKMEVGLATPDLVMWQLGTADALGRMPVEDFEESLKDTLVWLKEHNVDVVLIGLQYVKAVTKDEHYQAVRKALKRVATEQGVMRISRYEAIETIARIRSEQGTPLTGTRLTEASYECSAEYLARAIAVGLFHKDKATKPPLKKL